MGSHGDFQKTRVQYRDGPSSCHHCSDVTLFLYLAPHRLKLVQKFWGPSVEREHQNPSIPRATASRSYSAATTQGRTGAGGSHTGRQVTRPLSVGHAWSLCSALVGQWLRDEGCRPGTPLGMWEDPPALLQRRWNQVHSLS